MNKYNQLREEIILAVPEIVALKSGCKVSIPELKNNIAIIIHKERCQKTGKDFVNVVFPYDWNTDTYFVEDIEIIGRPISLEDCLIAIFKKYNTRDNKEQDSAMELDVELLHLIQTLWTLNIPLQDQSDECKELVYQLIVKK